jgi:hypothetical protein
MEMLLSLRRLCGRIELYGRDHANLRSGVDYGRIWCLLGELVYRDACFCANVAEA